MRACLRCTVRPRPFPAFGSGQQRATPTQQQRPGRRRQRQRQRLALRLPTCSSWPSGGLLCACRVATLCLTKIPAFGGACQRVSVATVVRWRHVHGGGTTVCPEPQRPCLPALLACRGGYAAIIWHAASATLSFDLLATSDVAGARAAHAAQQLCERLLACWPGSRIDASSVARLLRQQAEQPLSSSGVAPVSWEGQSCT